MATRSPLAVIISIPLVFVGCGHTDPGTPASLSLQPRVVVPHLEGQDLATAQRDMQRLGLMLAPEGLTKGSVCRPDEVCRIHVVRPAPGTEVPWGAKVEAGFLTSAESAFYRNHPRMPKAVGMSGAWAATVFAPVMGLVHVTAQPEPGLLPGTDRVLFQSPDAGTPLAIGQRVKLIVGDNRGRRSCGVRWWC